MDPPLEQFEESLDRVNRTLNYLTQVFLAQRGLSMSRYRILRYLQSRTEVNMRQLQSQLLLCGSTLTELVDALVQSGLVTRRRDEVDRRMVYLRLTADGRAAYREVLAFRCERLQEAMDGDYAGQDGINAALNSVYDGLKRQIATPEAKTGNRPAKERCDKNIEHGCDSK